LNEIDLAGCASLAYETGERIWREIGIPSYYYEAAALRPQCRNLSNVRLIASMAPPDIGGPAHHPTAGAIAIGARFFLIAFNIVLNTTDVAAAKRIATAIRASNGGLPCVKALGLLLASRSLAQVSMNLTDYRITPPSVVFDAVSMLAMQDGVQVVESELIGLAPRAAIDAAVAGTIRLAGWDESRILENRLAAAGFVLP
jgi:glutamate formiminotransferase/glutamate formiminotransferase/formiminotetrahydrofolate cyclodeaminase